MTGTSGGGSDNSGIFRGDGTTLMQVAREGQAAPDNNGSFADFTIPSLNDAGQVAFLGSITGTSGGASDDSGIFRGDGTTLTQIAREGQAAPDNNGSFAGFFDPTLNNAGQAAFYGFVNGTSGGPSDNYVGIFRGDGTTLTQIARTGQATPNSDGMLEGVLFAPLDPALNDLGQVAFLGDVDLQNGGAPFDEVGLFFYSDQLGLTSVARTGDSFDGSTITSISSGRGSLNNLGQVSYTYSLADGRRGVAIWTPIPEPAGLALLGVGGLCLLSHRRRPTRMLS